MRRFQNPSRYAPASQIVLTTTEADIALEQFQNDSSFLFEQLNKQTNIVSHEGFMNSNKGALEYTMDIVVKTVSAILKKIGELIKRFVEWIKGNKKDVKKKIDKTKTQTQTVYQKSESLFDNPDTREEALKLLKAKNEKYFGRNFLNGLTGHSNNDIILTAVLNSSPIFKTTYFKLGRDHLQDLLLAGRKLLYSEPFKNLEPAIRELAESRLRNDLGDGNGSDEKLVAKVGVYMVGCMTDLTSYAETITGREIEYPDEAAPSVILELLSNNIRDAVQLLITPVEGDFQKIKYLGKLHDIVTDLEDHVRILDDITDRISDVEDSLYKLTSDLAKMSNKASASGHEDAASKITELVKIYNAIISTVLHVNNTFYKMAIQTTDAIYNSAMDIGKLLDEVAKEVKQSDKPTTESVSTKPPSFKHQLALGIEGISFQDGSFFNALVEKVQDLRDSKDYSPKNIEKNGINQMVFEKTGMLIDFVVDPSPYVTANMTAIPITDHRR
jgi:uncharacterized protein YoxC